MIKEKWNQGWKFWKEENTFRLVFSVPKNAIDVELPYDAVFHQEQNYNSVNMGRTGFLDGGVFNYYKEYYVEENERGKHLRMYFEGSGGQTFVYVNGSLAGSCEYSYMPFYIDMVNYLKYGENNKILVMVNAMDLSSRYYAGGGLFRDVYLLRSDTVFLAPETLRVTTMEIQENGALVQVEALIQNDTVLARNVNINVRIEDRNMATVIEDVYAVRVPGQSKYHFSKKLFVERVTLWIADNPEMYTVRATLQWDGETKDRDEVKTGFRKITIDAVNGLRINGEKVKLRGACIHHDQGLLGGETYAGYEYRRVRILKEAGFNAVRCAHNPASKALLKACDQLGVYVLDEAFDMWGKMKNPADYSMFFEKGYRDVLASMVRTDYNHPSVILYSTGNEITEIAEEKGCELSYHMTTYLHTLDQTRYVTNGINGIFAAGNRLVSVFSDITGEDAPEAIKGDINQCMSTMGAYLGQIVQHREIGDLLERLDATMDVLGYNYMTGRYDMDCEQYKNRIIVGTETYPRQIAENWAAIMRNPAVIGDFTWTGYDYLGETGEQENYPWLQNASGDIDIVGVRKPISYYREIVFGLRTKPYMAVRSPEQTLTPRPFGPWQLTDAAATWDFTGSEGRIVTVEVYSAGQEVELFLNGISYGRKPADSEFAHMNTFDIPYEAGTLKAVSYMGEEVIGTSELTTTGTKRKWLVEAESIGEEGQNEELVFLSIGLMDMQNHPVAKAVEDLTVCIDGDAQLLALGCNDLKHNRGYQNQVISTKDGRALVILKKQKEAAAKISISAKGMDTHHLLI